MTTDLSCPDCGNTATVETHVAHAANHLTEAIYYCVGCRRHRGFFAYGAWAHGTRQLPEGAELTLVVAAINKAREHPGFQSEQLAALKEATGQPLMLCRKAYSTANGDFLAAKKHLLSRNIENSGLLVTYAY